MKTRFLSGVAAGVGIFAALMGCMERGGDKMDKDIAKAAPKFVTAEVKIIKDGDGKLINAVKTLKDEGKVANLAAYFPGVDQGKKSDLSGAWKARAEIIFTKKDGGKVKVNTNYRSWSEGTGDWEPEPGLEEFLKKLFE